MSSSVRTENNYLMGLIYPSARHQPRPVFRTGLSKSQWRCRWKYDFASVLRAHQYSCTLDRIRAAPTSQTHCEIGKCQKCWKQRTRKEKRSLISLADPSNLTTAHPDESAHLHETEHWGIHAVPRITIMHDRLGGHRFDPVAWGVHGSYWHVGRHRVKLI